MALLLHGAGTRRVKSGLHYIVVNLRASFLFLIGVAMIYGMTGTLNMADLAAIGHRSQPEIAALFEAGAAILGIAFLIKAGVWPLNFWLPAAYTAASAPVAAVFSLMTKVGVYAVLRVGSLLHEPLLLGEPGLFYGGIATMVFGIVGMLAARQLRASWPSASLSTGMLLAAIGLGASALTAPTASIYDGVGARERRVLPADRHDGAHAQRTRPRPLDSPSAHPVTYAAFRSANRRIRTTPTTKSASRSRLRWPFSVSLSSVASCSSRACRRLRDSSRSSPCCPLHFKVERTARITLRPWLLIV